jgi:lipopolysaccharide export system protein LptC
MSVAPVTAPVRPAERLVGIAATRHRRPPTAGRIARRRLMILLAKLALPVLALALLTTMAIWPELKRSAADVRWNIHEMIPEVAGDTVIDAHFHGIDERGRPYTVTASEATQVNPDRINLTTPKGDVTLQNGTWLMLQSKDGVYRKQEDALDLSHAVTLYRDDGTTMLTESAAIDMKSGAAAGAQPVHAEGPFGVLDAKGGFTFTDKGEEVQFAGPAHLVLNGANAQ